MNHVAPIPEPHRVGPVEPDLLASAVFLFSEYLSGIATEAPGDDEDEDGDIDDDAASGPQIDTRAVLDIFAEALATDTPGVRLLVTTSDMGPSSTSGEVLVVMTLRARSGRTVSLRCSTICSSYHPSCVCSRRVASNRTAGFEAAPIIKSKGLEPR